MQFSLEQQASDENTPPDRLWVLAKQSIELQRLVAKNPSAHPELLRELAYSDNKGICEGVVSNPNTPIDALLKLAELFPQQFLANPVFPLLLLENPNLPIEISYWTLLKILEQDEIPELFLANAATHRNSEILYAITRHRKTPETVLEQIAIRNQYDVRLGLCIAKRRDVTERILLKLAEHKSARVRLHLAKHPKTPSNVLELLEKQESGWNIRVKIQKAIAQNPQTSLRLLEKLAGEHIKVKQTIARRRHLPINLIVQLAIDYQIHSMRVLTQNLSIPGSLLVQLTDHPEFRVRQMVAWHPNTPVEVLEKWADGELRKCIAYNSSTPVEFLAQLAADDDDQIQASVAQNPSTPGFVLEQLANYPTHDLLLSKHPNTPKVVLEQVLERLAMDERLSVRKYVAKHPHTPVKILTQWAKKSPELHPWIAQNPSTPIDILEQLLKKSLIEVRQAVAENPNTSTAILIKLSKDQEPRVRQSVAKNPNTPENILETLATHWCCNSILAQNPRTPGTALEKLADKSEICDLFLIRHPNILPITLLKVLERLAKNSTESVRIYVARHPCTPQHTLEKLSKDKETAVRQVALRNLSK